MSTSALLCRPERESRIIDRLTADLQGHGYRPLVLPSGDVLSRRPSSPSIDHFFAVGRFLLLLITERTLRSSYFNEILSRGLRHEAELGDIAILPVLLESRVAAHDLELRSPIDLAASYEQGLVELVDRMAGFRTRSEMVQNSSLDYFFAVTQLESRLADELRNITVALQSLSLIDLQSEFRSLLSGLDCAIDIAFSSQSADLDVFNFACAFQREKPMLVQIKRSRAGALEPGIITGLDLTRIRPHDGLATFFTQTLHSVEGSTDRMQLFGKINHCLLDVEWDLTREMHRWLSAWRGELASSLAAPLVAIHDAYSELVDEKFLRGLSGEEEVEFHRLSLLLDDEEEEYYRGAASKLETLIEKLNHEVESA